VSYYSHAINAALPNIEIANIGPELKCYEWTSLSVIQDDINELEITHK
jgi:hypothetical protein